jgi:hypothetical protein
MVNPTSHAFTPVAQAELRGASTKKPQQVPIVPIIQQRRSNEWSMLSNVLRRSGGGCSKSRAR